MKQIIFIIFLFMTFCACEEDIDPYNGKSGIYFDNKNILLDTVFIPWGLKKSEIKEQTLQLKVRLFGDVAPHDRKFSIDIISDEGDTVRAQKRVDCQTFPTEYTIPASQAETSISIQLLRTDALQTHARRFTIRLQENQDFGFLYSRRSQVDSVTVRLIDIQRVIYMDETFPEPGWWSRDGKKIFGDWSMKKSILICDVMDIDREVWVGDLVGTLTLGYLKYAGKYMHRWLQENPTPDENGELMQMGPDSQN